MDDRMWPTGCLNTVCEPFCGSFERAWTVLYNGREVVTDRLYKKI